jgi:DNA-binding NarL/FixJ family response regulator
VTSRQRGTDKASLGSCVDESTAMARNSNERWTPEEDKRLLKLRADGTSNILIAAALRRSLSSVQGRIYVIRKRAAGRANAALADRKRTTWSSADEQRLSEMHAAGASVSDIATAMDRTEAAIENRIYVLKHRTGRPAGTTLDRGRER